MWTKSLLILAVQCLLVAAHSERPVAEEASEKCLVKHNLTKEEVQFMNESKTINPQDDNVKCFLKCFYTEMNVMNEKGEFTLDDPSNKDLQRKEHVAACTNVTGTDSCDKAFHFAECLQKSFENKQKTGA